MVHTCLLLAIALAAGGLLGSWLYMSQATPMWIIASDDDACVSFFHALDDGRKIRLGDMYYRVRDGITYTPFAEDHLHDPLPILDRAIKPAFRLDGSAKRYGFVIRRCKAFPYALKNDDVRVLWLSPVEFERCLTAGELRLPPLDDLPKIDLKEVSKGK